MSTKNNCNQKCQIKMVVTRTRYGNLDIQNSLKSR